MYPSIRKISYFLVFLCLTEICYGKDTETGSLISTLSTMDLKNVKAENDKKIASILSKLHHYQEDKKNADAEQIQSVTPQQSVLKDNDSNPRDHTLQTPDKEKQLQDKSEPPSAKLTNEKDKKINKEDENIPVTGKKVSGTDDLHNGSDSKELKREVEALNKKLSLMMNELDALVELQRVAYENQSISNELQKSNPVSSINKVTKKEESYISKYNKQKNVKIDPSGFSYHIIKAGSVKILPDNLFRLTLEEKTIAGKRLSYVNDATLKYSENLPQLIYKALQYIGYGGEIEIVAQAEKNYSNGNYPAGIGPNTPLVYSLKVPVVN